MKKNVRGVVGHKINNSLPPRWYLATLDGVCTQVTDGTHDSPKPHEKGVPLVTGKYIKNGTINFKECYLISIEDHNEVIKRSKAESGDILFTNIGTLGELAMVPSGVEFSIKNVALLKPNHQVLGKYLYYYLSSQYCKNSMKRIISGSSQRFLSLDVLREFPIPVPPFETQKKIVAILEKAEDIKRLRAEANAQTQKLIQSVFLDIFGDPVKNPKKWEVLKLGQCALIERGRFSHRPRNEPRFYGGQYPFIQTGDITNSNGKLTTYNQTLNEDGLKISKKFPKNTIVMSIAANIGDTAIMDFDGCFPDSVVGISPYLEYGTPYYFEMMLRFFRKTLGDYAPQVAQKNINLKILSELYVPVPPIKLQNQFFVFVEKCEAIREQQAHSSHSTRNLFEMTSKRSFMGELLA